MREGATLGNLVIRYRLSQEVTSSIPARFFDVEYSIDAHLVQGEEKVTVRFQAVEGSSVAGVFGIRMIRANAER